MSNLNDRFVPYAHAERELSDKAGPLLTAIIKEVERRNGIHISEIRVTIENPGHLQRWGGSICFFGRYVLSGRGVSLAIQGRRDACD